MAGGEALNRLLAAALTRAQSGARVVPLYSTDPDGVCDCSKKGACESPGKHPRTARGLDDASSDPNTIRRWWDQWPIANVGERTDDVARIDIDLVDVASVLADDIPLRAETEVVETPRGGLHIAFRTPRPIAGTTLWLTDGRKLGELKAARGYVLVPPSRARGREYVMLSIEGAEPKAMADPVAWLRATLPAFGFELGASSPRREYERLASSVHEGNGRHNALVSYAGKVWVDGMDGQTLAELLSIINARQCIPPLPDDELQDIARHFVERRHPQDFDVLADPERPLIIASDRHLHEMAADGWRTLDHGLYLHGASVVEVRRDGVRAHIASVGQARMRGKLDRAAAWMREAKRGLQKASPPKDVVDDMLATPIALPVIRGVIGTPAFASDGTLDTTVGYQRSTQLYHEPAGEPIQVVPQRPDASDVRRARMLIQELLQDFEFADTAGAAHAIAVVITAMAREMIDGPCPLFAFDAPTPGTGKTLLAQCLGIVIAGHAPAVMSEPRGDEEMRKRITSVLLDGMPMVVLDNVKRVLRSEALAVVLTSTTWGDRALGRNESLRLPVRNIWAVTGNNLQLDVDLARRTIWLRLDAKVDRPWQRSGFRNQLPEWAIRHRHELVWAFLVLIQHWITSGHRPWVGQPLGSYEVWSSLVGGVLEAAGINGFLANREQLYRRMDGETEEWRAFVRCWWDAFGERPVRCADLLPMALDAMPSLFLDAKDLPDHQRAALLGRAMKTRLDRRYESLFIKLADGDAHKKVNLWRLECAGDAADRSLSPADPPQNQRSTPDSAAGVAGDAGVFSYPELQEENERPTRKEDAVVFEPPQPPQPPQPDSAPASKPAGDARGSAGESRCIDGCGRPTHRDERCSECAQDKLRKWGQSDAR